MPTKLLIPLFALAVLLSACSAKPPKEEVAIPELPPVPSSISSIAPSASVSSASLYIFIPQEADE
ncbi:MAG: hypothetical protein QF793_00545 [Candidatus Peribacteraceae bacterium]|jgi:hypothetical protein|nr:hypothetical protein [bacterium]MDP6561395.1 hypothetical protein [Candidatus Peribacteraceae bacterium]|tara:strand:+ start:6507 stop:6701 length:195 start_codon:yes stop_codon:yes gene_type:complete